MEHDRTIMNAVLSGIAVFVAAIAALSFIYFVLGFISGIFGMCATASQEWENIYWKLYFLIPIIAVTVGIVVGKRTYKSSQFQ